MDEEYILVSKEAIKKYKEEISNLKKQLNQKPQNKEGDISNNSVDLGDVSNSLSVDVSNNVVTLIKREFALENDKIIKHLEDIKELNKSTLDNLLTNTKQLDDRLENMIDTISELVNTLSKTIDSFTTSNEFDLKMLASKIDKIPLVQSQIDNFQGGGASLEVKDKLQEILMFMKNLRVLLSYVKPSDMVINKAGN